MADETMGIYLKLCSTPRYFGFTHVSSDIIHVHVISLVGLYLIYVIKWIKLTFLIKLVKNFKTSQLITKHWLKKNYQKILLEFFSRVCKCGNLSTPCACSVAVRAFVTGHFYLWFPDWNIHTEFTRSLYSSLHLAAVSVQGVR